MERYLITGGAGFIGSNIARALVGRGALVRVLDDFSSGREENLASVRESVEIVRGSVTDPDCVRKALDGVEFVIHLAAVPSVPRSMREPLRSDEANVRGTLNLFEEARKCPAVKRVVVASSSSVYGENPVQPKHEGLACAPISVYGATKAAGELYAAVFRRAYGLPVICLRYFNVFGPGQDPDSQYAAVIPSFFKAVLQGRSPVIFGTGEQTRDFTFVGNVVNANLAACGCPLPENLAFNIACASPVSLLELFSIISRLAGFTGSPVHEPARPGDILHSSADISRAVRELGYSPAWTLREGLSQTFEYFREIF